MSVPLKATIWFAACQFLQRGINMITTPVFTRLLSLEEYGRASTFLSWADLIMPLITLSCWRGMLNLFAKDKDKDDVLSSTISLSLIIGLFWGIILFSLQHFIGDFIDLSPTLYIGLFAYCLAQNLFYAWTVRMQYDYKYKGIVTASMLYTILSVTGGVLFVVLYSKTAESKILPQVACLLAVVLVLIVLSLRKSRKLFDFSVWKFCLFFAIPLIPHYLSEVVLQSSDRIMIEKMCSTSDVAIYSIAYAVGSLINLVASAINSAFVPFQYQTIKAGEYDKLSKSTNYVILFVAVCLCMLMFFGREIVFIFGGEKYVGSVALIIPICLGVFFNYVFQIFARVQEYYEQKITITIASVLCAGLNILLNYIFIRLYGYAAAAYTTFACYFMFCFLHYLFYRHACKKHVGRPIYNIKTLCIISLALMVLSVGIFFMENVFYVNFPVPELIIKYSLFVITIVIILIMRKRIIAVFKNMMARR